MAIFKRLKIRVSKFVLLLMLGILWTFAGVRVFSVGFADLFEHTANPWPFFLISAIIFYAFHRLIFRSMVEKHTLRIMSSELPDHCVFSFFDLQGYAIMVFMITLGIVARKMGFFPPLFLAVFYLGIGAVLFFSGCRFFIAVFKHKRMKMNENG